MTDYYKKYYEHLNPATQERAGLNAYGPVGCAIAIFVITTLILFFLVVLPGYLIYWLNAKTKVNKEDLPTSNLIMEDDFAGWK
jgi:hypothetical protein